MTDYLELLLGSAEALLEQVRKMDRSRLDSARNGDETEENPKGTRASSTKSKNINNKNEMVYNLKRTVDHVESEVNQLNTAGKGRSGPLSEIENRSSRERETELETSVRLETRIKREGDKFRRRHSGKWGEEQSSPLAGQLERLDWAASVPPRDGGGASLHSPGERSGYPLSLEGPALNGAYSGTLGAADGVQRAGGGTGGIRRAGGETGRRWAEEADRAFRRDSRRYDGGFYLY